jgi:hypothetical protein
MGTKFEQRRSTTGSLLNFFIGVNAKIFIGTKVSSFSHDLLATRFYRGMMENLQVLAVWTPPMDAARNRRATGIGLSITIEHAGILSYV